MVRGRPRTEVQDMTQEELAEASARVENVESPLPALKAAKGVDVQAPDGTVRKTVGVFTKPAQVGHQQTLKQFARIIPNYKRWIQMTAEEATEYEAQGLLVGYNADEGIGLIKEE